MGVANIAPKMTKCPDLLNAAGHLTIGIKRLSLMVLALTLQQTEHLLWQLVGLRHHGCACLLQDLRTR
jgi:hypothetical protein